MIRAYVKPTIAAFAVVLALFLSGPVEAGDYPTGVEWSQSSSQVKRAYVLGIANAIGAEHEIQVRSARPPTDAQSAVPRFYKAASKTTLDQTIAAIDDWYAKNPEQLNQEVLDVLWITLVKR